MQHGQSPNQEHEQEMTQEDHITPVQNPRNDPIKEKAAQFLATVNEDRTFTVEEEKAVLRRIDRRILPLLLGAYFFQQLDKSSLSYVSIFGIVEDANLHGQQYSWLGSILYLAQLVMQPIAALLLVKLPTGKLIGSAVLLWGSSLAIMAACTNFPSLLGLRFTLGAFEAMIACSPTDSAISIATAYSHTRYRPSSLVERQKLMTKCLSDREKVIAVERLRANQMGIISREWRWDHVRETFYDLKTWCWFFLIVSISIPSGGISTFGNLIIKSFGYNSFETILFNIPFGVIQILAIIGGGWLATRFQRKGLVIVGFALVAAVGTLLMIVVPREQKGVLLFGYYLVSCLAAITPLIYAWEAQNTAGDTKRKCTSAVVLVGMCAGNVCLLLISLHRLLSFIGHWSPTIFHIASTALSAWVDFQSDNAKRRRDLGKSAHIVDESMLSKKHLEGKALELEEIAPAPPAPTEDKGFSDSTDLKNEDFVYVY
ncbi:MFS transporter, putative [Aspergillus fumigatus A1163]|uniref:MFS transporter, putative n=1 Tax=Aspergillus fumigatus (strain CBS 144.89 / FGSC A1163 / CEA10) TaxID=451804 RepID=B0YF02_ASPFC|nr:MFS transporter, putative [Aspergillus fumigatus A1163]